MCSSGSITASCQSSNWAALSRVLAWSSTRTALERSDSSDSRAVRSDGFRRVATETGSRQTPMAHQRSILFLCLRLTPPANRTDCVAYVRRYGHVLGSRDEFRLGVASPPRSTKCFILPRSHGCERDESGPLHAARRAERDRRQSRSRASRHRRSGATGAQTGVAQDRLYRADERAPTALRRSVGGQQRRQRAIGDNKRRRHGNV